MTSRSEGDAPVTRDAEVIGLAVALKSWIADSETMPIRISVKDFRNLYGGPKRADLEKLCRARGKTVLRELGFACLELSYHGSRANAPDSDDYPQIRLALIPAAEHVEHAEDPV